MNSSFDIKKYIPHIVAVFIFALITLVYFSPLIGGKKQLQQGDVRNYMGMSKEVRDYRETTGKEALWTNSMFGGMPAYQISTVYHGNLISHVNQILTFTLPYPSGYVFMYMFGFFILLLVLRVNPWIAIIGAIAFGFSSYFFIIIEAGHNSKAQAIGYMAPVVAGFILCYRGKFLIGACVTALFLSLELFANHLQITYYLAILLFIYCMAEFVNAIITGQFKTFMYATLVIGGAAILAVLPNITNIWATYDYGKFTTRGKSELTLNEQGRSNAADKTDGLDRSYATGWSYGVGETMTLLVPNFKGGSSEAVGNHHPNAADGIEPPELKDYVLKGVDAYFGDQPFTSGPVYAGAIIIFLFVIGLIIVKGPLKWALLGATLLSILLAWGSNFMGFTNFFFDHIPGYNKFRAVSMILVIAEFTIPLLAILALDQMIKSSDFFHEKIKVLLTDFSFDKKKAFFIGLGVTGGLCLLMWLAPGGFNTFYKSEASYKDGTHQNERDRTLAQVAKQNGPEIAGKLVDGMATARMSIFKADVGRSLIFIILAGGLLFLYFRGGVNPNLVIAGMGIFILIDLFAVDKRYLNNDSFVPKEQVKIPYTASDADLQILQDKDPDYRVFNVAVNTFNDASTSYFHKSIGGYHGAKLKRYQELIDFQIMKNNQSVLNMLNTKYVITVDQHQQSPDQERRPIAVPNPNALGHAWFVSDYKQVVSADSEITALSNFDPAKTAIVDKRFAPQIEGLKPAKDSTASIILKSYEPNDLVYETSNKGEGLAVFSEIYYEHGWNAYLNGKIVPHFRVNYVLRGMRVPAGKNTVEFKFEPALYFTGEKISYAGSIILLLFCAGGGFMSWRNCAKEQEKNKQA